MMVFVTVGPLSSSRLDLHHLGVYHVPMMCALVRTVQYCQTAPWEEQHGQLLGGLI